MYELFNTYGECEVRLLTNRDTGKPKGVGFVEYGSVSHMKKAIGKSDFFQKKKIGNRTVIYQLIINFYFLQRLRTICGLETDRLLWSARLTRSRTDLRVAAEVVEGVDAAEAVAAETTDSPSAVEVSIWFEKLTSPLF